MKKNNNSLNSRDRKNEFDENMYIFNFDYESYQYNNMFDEVNLNRKKSEYIYNIQQKADEFKNEWQFITYQEKVQICSETDRIYNMWLPYWNARDYDNAIKYAIKALKIKPDNDNAISMLANYYKNKDEDDIAIGLYKIAIGLTPVPNDKSRYYVNLGNIYFELGNQQQGISCYKNAASFGHAEAKRWLIQKGYFS